MSDDSGDGKPPNTPDYTVELSGVELDALRSSSEHMAASLAGASVDEGSAPEDATNPGVSRDEFDVGGASLGGARPLEVSPGELTVPNEEPVSEPVDDPTTMIDRASLRALTQSQESEGLTRGAPRGDGEDATRSIDRGALAHIIDEKGATRPFGIRKRKKDQSAPKGEPTASASLPPLSELRSSLESLSEPSTTERPRPSATSLELPALAGFGKKPKPQVPGPSLKLPSLSRPKIEVPDARDEEPEASATEAPAPEALAPEAPAPDAFASESEYELEPISHAEEPRPVVEPPAEGVSAGDVFDTDDGADAGAYEEAPVGSEAPEEVEEIQEDAPPVSQEHALAEAEEDALDVVPGGKPWARNLVILGALMCVVGGVVAGVSAWSAGLPLLVTGVVCLIAGLAFGR